MTSGEAGSVRALIEGDTRFLDSAVVSHGFAPFLRDYDVVVDVPAAKPDGSGSYIMGRFRYRFTHCPETSASTSVPPDGWRTAWDDVFTDYAAWERAGAPDGYVWGVDYALAYPGMSYVDGSDSATHWSERFGRDMHEVLIETNAWDIRVVFHALQVAQLAVGDPATGTLREVPADAE